VKRLFALLTVLIILSGCSAARRATIETPKITQPLEGKSLISFVMGANKHPAHIWDGTKAIGLMMPRTIFQYEAEPGEHQFLAHYGKRTAVLEAELAPDKHYVVNIRVFPFVGAKFIPVRGVDLGPDQVQKWFRSYDTMKTEDEYLANYEKRRKEYIERVLRLQGEEGSPPKYPLKPDEYYDLSF